jgi:hypothetical protein
MFDFTTKKKNALGRFARSVILPCAAALALAVMTTGCGGDNESGCGIGRFMADPISVFAHDGNVYVGGIQYDPCDANPFGKPVAVLWRDGKVHRRLPESGYLCIVMENVPYDTHLNVELNSPVIAPDGSVYALTGSLPRPRWDPDSPVASMSTVAGYWKDGEVHYLDVPDDSGTYSLSTSIFISDANDVYIVGNTLTDDRFAPGRPILWKNGEPSFLGDGNQRTTPNSVFASGEDVYVTGTDTVSYSAVLWKNGERQHLEGGEDNAAANQVSVHGDDVYVLGRSGGDIVVWKNGAITMRIAPTDDNGYAHHATSLFALDGDVYLSGYMDVPNTSSHDLPVIWKNNEKTILPTPHFSADVYLGRAYGVFVKGNDVYVAGGSLFLPVLWKNGVMQELPFAEVK